MSAGIKCEVKENNNAYCRWISTSYVWTVNNVGLKKCHQKICTFFNLWLSLSEFSSNCERWIKFYSHFFLSDLYEVEWMSKFHWIWSRSELSVFVFTIQFVDEHIYNNNGTDFELKMEIIFRIQLSCTTIRLFVCSFRFWTNQIKA